MTCFSILAYCDGHLLVFSDTHLDIFNTQTAEWVQSVGLKRTKPLSNQGHISLTYVNDSPSIIYLANMHTSEYLSLLPTLRTLLNHMLFRRIAKHVHRQRFKVKAETKVFHEGNQ